MTLECVSCKELLGTAIYEPQSTQRGLKVYCCMKCGLLQSHPRIDHVRERYHSLSNDASWGNVRVGKGLRARDAARYILKNVLPSDIKSVLDIGAGHGELLSYLVDFIGGTDFTMIEPDTKLTIKVPGTIRRERFEDSPLYSPCDLVVFFHTLEHLAQPREMVRKALEMLALNGRMYIEVPNTDFITRNDIVEEYFIDKHLTHFTWPTLHNMMLQLGLIPAANPDIQMETVSCLFKRGIQSPFETIPVDTNHCVAITDDYAKKIAQSNTTLRHIADDLNEQAMSHKLVIWGAGRIFHGLVANGLDTSKLLSVVDESLQGLVSHGVEIKGPQSLRLVHPGLVFVASRMYGEEIRKLAESYVRPASIATFSDYWVEEPSNG